MRRRFLLWLVVSLACFVVAIYFWRLGDRWAAQKSGGASSARPAQSAAAPSAAQPAPAGPVRLLTSAGNLNSPLLPRPAAKPAANDRLAYRLSNTAKPLKQLVRSQTAVLLENALLDTAETTTLPIPDHLRAQGDPGAYIIQSRGPLDNAFRALLQAAGADIVAYIPNNAYLVRASENAAHGLAGRPQVQAVLPYEPYYKLKPALLALALTAGPLPEQSQFNVLLFPNASESVVPQLSALGLEVLSQERSPFGPVLKVRPAAARSTGASPVAAGAPTAADLLPALARLSGVQEVEWSPKRIPANDLSRKAVGVASSPVSPTNYLDLTGANVLVNVNDTGVDATHPDLVNRVFLDPADLLGLAGTDINGHGTHVAGIIAGDGTQSLTVTNAQGSVMPPTNGQFRGMAPGASLFSMRFTLPDPYLQETAARTNVLISENSWTYAGADYDLAAASYDAAVRDALPGLSGSQPLLFVFPSGNVGNINNDRRGSNNEGLDGDADTILSPGTAKNVITVGAVEQARRITNQVWDCFSDPTSTNGVTCLTNQPWLSTSDSSNQVAGFSSRGNTGIAIEGEFGRFKPDLVAPGTFVVSTRSTTWDEARYYDPTNYTFDFINSLVIETNATFDSVVLVPDNAVRLVVRALAVTTNLPVTVTSPAAVPVTRAGEVDMPRDGALTPVGDSWSYSVSNNTALPVTVSVQTIRVTTNDSGNYYEVLSNLNNSLSGVAPHYYRYESGTSMAAANVAGTLALMQEFFEQRLRVTNSPALMKALLINGARALADIYNFQVNSLINYQGWGQAHLPTSLPGSLSNLVSAPAGPGPMFVFDQSPTNALASGQSHTRLFTVAPDAQKQPMRFTLVWTDPPGNPAAGVKLVNDLDLVVTNLDTGDVFWGNDLQPGTDYNAAWDTNQAPNLDVVNNVENVYLLEAFGTNYSVTVVGRHVNVNAVTAQTNDVTQDYALVVSSGDGQVADALTLAQVQPAVSVDLPYVTYVTNSFGATAGTENPLSGGLLLHQHVGANSPLVGTNTIPLNGNAVITLGETNQWHFYVLTNELSLTNAAFVTFLPPTLSVPRMGVEQPAPDNATRIEADIDLYVSTNPGLTNLDPVAVAGADKSLRRGGTEVVSLTGAPTLASVYYVGIKSEDHQAAEYAFLGVFSTLPLSSSDTNGNQYLRGVPAPAAIPAGSPSAPQAALVLGINPLPIQVRRVVVTNTFTHRFPGSLLGNLSHGQKFAVLNNHTCATDPAGDCYTNSYDYIYEDSGQNDIDGSRHSDGPGSLRDFVGEEGLGVWLLTMVNNFPIGEGQEQRLSIKLEPQQPQDGNNAISGSVEPNSWWYNFVDVPLGATNLTVCLANTSANPLPLQLYIRRGDFPTQTIYDQVLMSTNGCLNLSSTGLPPLSPGRYYIGIFNPNAVVQTFRLIWTIELDLNGVVPTVFSSAGTVPMLDDAVTNTVLFVTNHQRIAALEVGLRADHPRISDLAFTLVSPAGKRVLLMENRGGTSSNGIGSDVFATNAFSDFEVGAGDYFAVTNVDGWLVTSNKVAVTTGAANSGGSSLALQSGQIMRTLPTTAGQTYSLSFAYRQAPALQGLVAWWKAEGNGNDVVNGNTAIPQAGPTPFVAGRVGQAFLMNSGTSGYMMASASPSLNVGPAGGLTIEAWINPSSVDGFHPIAEWNNGIGRIGTEFWIGTTPSDHGVLNCYLTDTAGTPHQVRSLAGAVVANVWQHIAVTYDRTSGIGALYINGARVAQQTFVPFVPQTTFDFWICHRPNDRPGDWTYNTFLSGPIDELSLFNRALTQTEIQAIYAVGAAGKCGLAFPPAVCLGGDAQVLINGVPTGAITGTTNWQTNTISFTATQASTPLTFAPLTNSSSVLLDSFTLIGTVTRYLTFTENTNLTTTPIKFASPTFANPGMVTSNLLSGFEVSSGDYSALTNVDGWAVLTNQVSSITDPTLAHSGSGLIALAKGNIARTVPTRVGNSYAIKYAYRGPGIVALWRAEGNGNDSILGLMPATYTGIAPSVGEVGQAFSCNGFNSRISITDRPDFILTNSLTMDVWVRPASIGPGVIFWRGDNRPGMDPYSFSQPGDGTVWFQVMQDNANWDYLNVTLPINQWTCLVGTLDGWSGLMTLYTNGVLAGQKPTALRPFGALDPARDPNLGIGNLGEHFASYPFNGLIDEPSIYNRALSASEIKAIYAANRAGNPKFDTAAALPAALAEARVIIGNISSNVIFGNNTNWQFQTTPFTAVKDTLSLKLDGLQPGMLLDSFTLTDFGGSELYYLPEMSLDALKGDDAFGPWTLEMWDSRTGATNLMTLDSWQLRFYYENTNSSPISLAHGVPATNTIPPGEIAYFIVDVPPWAQYATNILVSASLPVNLLFNQDQPPTTNTVNFTLLSDSTGGIGNPVLSLVTVPPLVPGARYYLGVQNTNAVPVTAAVQVDFDVTALANGIPVNGTMPANVLPRYFSYTVSSNATAVAFQLTNLTGNLDLVARKSGLPTSTPGSYHYGSFNLGTNDEDILVFTNSTPVPLSPGIWFLEVFNVDLNVNDYTIVATEYTTAFPTIITLTNAIPYAATNTVAGQPNDYYRYVVSPYAVGAQFEINSPTAEVTLVAHKLLPPPDLGSYDLISTNPGTSDELIVCYNNSSPVRLTPGDWFLTAVNVSGGPAAYSIMATELFANGTDIIITASQANPNSFCLTWTSVPGLHYFVEAKPDLLATNWTLVSPHITAVDYSTTWCLGLPSPYHFFRVGQGVLPASTVPPPVRITSITSGPGGVLLQWSAAANRQFNVLWTPSLPTALWNTFTNAITSTNTLYQFLDDGSQSGGLGATRYYRLQSP